MLKDELGVGCSLQLHHELLNVWKASGIELSLFDIVSDNLENN